MLTQNDADQASLNVGEAGVVARVGRRSGAYVADILGRVPDGDNHTLLYLDRLIHSVGVDSMGDQKQIGVSGAVSTVLRVPNNLLGQGG